MEAKYHLLINKHKNVSSNFVIILKLLLNNRMLWMIFMNILINTIHINQKIVFDNMIAYMLSNQKLNSLVIE